MKRTLCLVFAAALLLTVAAPLSASAAISFAPKYSYEDFEATTFNGSNPTDWSGLQYGSSVYARGGVGHTDNTGALSIVNTAADSSKVTAESAGKTSDNAYTWNAYTYAKHETLTSNKDKVAEIPADFDGNALLLSYDVYVPAQGLYSMQVDVYENGDKSAGSDARFIMGPRITNYPKENEYVSAGNRRGGVVVIGRQNSKANAGSTASYNTGTRTNVLDSAVGKWVNVSTIVTYDKAEEIYCAKSYVDGKVIKDGWGEAACYFKTTATGYFNEAGKDFGRHKGFKLKIVGNSNNANDRIRIDNIILREYGYASLNENQKITVGATEAAVPFVNAAVKGETAAPDAVKNANAAYSADFSASDIKAVKYAANDVFMAHGEEVGVSVSSKTENGVNLTIPALAEGEKLKLTFQNCGDFSGAALANSTTVLYNSDASIGGFLGIELADFDGETKALGADNTIPAAIKSMKLLKNDSTAAYTLTNGTSTYTSVYENGAYTFDFSTSTLVPNTTYQLKSGDTVAAEFTTDAGELSIGAVTNAGGKAAAEVRNITSEAQTVYLIYAIYAEDDSLIDLDYKDAAVAAGSILSISTDNALTDPEAKTAKVFVWDSFVNAKPLDKSREFTIQ